MTMNEDKTYDIIPLPKETYKGAILPISYTTTGYYDVSVDGFDVSIRKKTFPLPVTHTPEEYDFPDRLYADWWDGAEAVGVVDGGELLAAIETCPEEWSNRLIVTELWVDSRLRGQGYGRRLIESALRRAKVEKRRAVILETQSCNMNAIGFYRHMGFSLIGFDTCCYSNDDPGRHEVRLDLGLLLDAEK